MTEKPISSNIPIAKKRSDIELPENATSIKATEINEYSRQHQTLQENFNNDFAEQIKQMTETAKSLLILQMTIPALFTAILKLFHGDKAILNTSNYMESILVVAAFLIWMLALWFALSALRPSSYLVNSLTFEKKMRGEADQKIALGLLDFYQKITKKKYQEIIISSWLTFSGIVIMLSNILIF